MKEVTIKNYQELAMRTCLKRNIAKLAGRKERGTIGGNGDAR